MASIMITDTTVLAKWKDFGLKCGLYHNTLEAIQANNAGKPRPAEECFRDCVARWLRREDNVNEEGEPTLQRLADIVENIKCEDNHKKLVPDTPAQNFTILWWIILPVSVVVAIISIIVILMHASSSTTAIDEYAFELRDEYNENLTRFRDPDENKFPAAGPSFHDYVPFIPLKLIKVERHSTENAEFFKKASVEQILEKFESIEIHHILKPLKDKQLRFVLIEGEPGIGKSTLAKELTLRWVRQTDEYLNNFKVVIFIALRHETYQKAKTFEDLLIDVEDINMTEIALSIKKTKGAGVLWVLDGFDELPHQLRSNSTSIFIKLIKGDILRKSTKIVITRHAASFPLYTYLEHNSKSLYIVGFSPNETRKYATKYFESNKTLADEFQSYYNRNTMVESMLYNPMNCFIMCTVFNDFIRTDNKKYPRTMTEIYNHYVCILLKRHLIDKKVIEIRYKMPRHLICKMDFSISELAQSSTWNQFYFLSEIAYNGSMRQEYIFKNEFHNLSMITLGMMDTNIGFAGFDEDEFSSFIHTTLQEYFAAIYLVNNPDFMFTIEDLKQNSNLEVVLTFYVGLLKLLERKVDNETMNIILNHDDDILNYIEKVSKHHNEIDSHITEIKNHLINGMACKDAESDITPYIQLTSLMLRCMYEQDSLLQNRGYILKKYLLSHYIQRSKSKSTQVYLHIKDFDYFICGYIVATHNITLQFEPFSSSEIIAFKKGLQSHPSVNGKIKIRIYNTSIEGMITELLTIPIDMVTGLQLATNDNVSACQIISKFSSLQEITFPFFNNLHCNSVISKHPLLKLKKLKKLIVRIEKASKNAFELLKQFTARGQPLKRLHICVVGAENIQILNLIEMQFSLEVLRIEVSVLSLNPRSWGLAFNFQYLKELNVKLKFIWCKSNNSLKVNDNELLAEYIGVSKIQLNSYTSFIHYRDRIVAATIYSSSEPVTSDLSDFIKYFRSYRSFLKTKRLTAKDLNRNLKTRINKFIYAMISPSTDQNQFVSFF
uniref:NACHT domain-containing protein n=1 Tax=Amphimedon queenslandica TaxID=400682 RepID=A0A1X7UHT1_AMPQE